MDSIICIVRLPTSRKMQNHQLASLHLYTLFGRSDSVKILNARTHHQQLLLMQTTTTVTAYTGFLLTYQWDFLREVKSWCHFSHICFTG